MRLNQLTSAIPSLYATGTPVTLVGPPGIGKTDFVRTLPALLSAHTGHEFGLVVREATGMDAPDVLGILVPQKREDGVAVSCYTMPDIMRAVEATGLEHGVLFIDEVGQGDALVQKALASLFNEGRIGDYTLPTGWYVMGATNRVEDRAGVARELMHFINRQCRIDIEPDIQGWLRWARDTDIHHMLMAFANFRPGVVISDKVPAKPGPYCTPRSFTAAARFLVKAGHAQGLRGDNTLPDDEVTQGVVAGYIGQGASAELFGFLRVEQHLPQWADIVSNPMEAKLPPVDRFDAAYAASSLVIARGDADTLDAGFTYCQRLPVELQTMVVRGLVDALGGDALASPAVTEFIAEHTALVSDSL